MPDGEAETISRAARCSSDFLPPSPPAEKATARQYQAEKASTGDGAPGDDMFDLDLEWRR